MNDRSRINRGLLLSVFVQAIEPQAVVFQHLCNRRPSTGFKLRRIHSLLPCPQTNEVGQV